MTHTQKEVKLLNQSIRRIADRFGTRSTTYRSMVKSVLNGSYGDYISINARGIIQVKNTESVRNSSKGKRIINALLNDVQTYSELAKEVGSRSALVIEVTNKQYEEAKDGLESLLYTLYLYGVNIDDSPQLQALHKSHNTKQEIIQTYETARRLVDGL